MSIVGYETANNNGYETEKASHTSKKNFTNDDDILEDMDEALTEYMKRRITVLMQSQS